ncbi:hydantoinase/oxoprolinase family protein [Allopusillimonas ginsengisoli]|uniref:hydantoinase/oxoprolinase family protein n=1 Tax=Allopusillimonas ginsengisoli TaxID=453575 RepID=UPI001021E8D5|nr:hydantoinase/oxoprolinase family protein [Allopusillimonas ginsengisoli]TEA77036.1 hydantoinase/oxoprolinase family protein [Allopusillimonas ginsengisoli]
MSSRRKQARAGVDIGGTFTDIALELDDQLYSVKVLTDYEAPERAIVKGLQQAAQEAGIALSDISLIIHGTTLATNALIEREGARTAFITTEGFRDVLEMRTENRFEQYDLNIKLPPALIARCDRHTLRERMDAQGQALIAPSAADIGALVTRIAEGNYESVAIGFVHAYVNGEHERQMRDALLKRLPDLSISISSEVSPQIREFERFNTVCANAYVRPRMESYLNRLVQKVHEAGAQCPVFIMHSGGGIVSVESASRFPVRLVESGPAGGAIFAAYIAARYELASVLSFDMGGTTAKICLIDDQVPKTANTFEVARTYRFKKGSGMPISIPVVEMVEIGAGGGSIASVDIMDQIRVGPQSAGSEPGPASYQHGGQLPTVSDADLLLGRLDPHNFAGGSITLSPERASEAVQKQIGERLTLTPAESAYGIAEVVDENMSNAARVHAVENGKEIASYTMITFGGAGPLHAARLCEKTGIERFIVPPGAGVGSAIGFLRAPFGYESIRSINQKLSQFDSSAAKTLINELRDEATQFVSQRSADEAPVIEAKIYMRYVGQGWEIPVALSDEADLADVAALRAAFEATYARYFGRPIEGLDIETISWSVKASSPLPPVPAVPATTACADAPSAGKRYLFDARLQQDVEADIVERDHLTAGMRVQGPAMIVEKETSTLVTSAFEAIVQTDGCLLVQRKPA